MDQIDATVVYAGLAGVAALYLVLLTAAVRSEIGSDEPVTVRLAILLALTGVGAWVVMTALVVLVAYVSWRFAL